jgi:hypothetical protein
MLPFRMRCEVSTANFKDKIVKASESISKAVSGVKAAPIWLKESSARKSHVGVAVYNDDWEMLVDAIDEVECIDKKTYLKLDELIKNVVYSNYELHAEQVPDSFWLQYTVNQEAAEGEESPSEIAMCMHYKRMGENFELTKRDLCPSDFPSAADELNRQAAAAGIQIDGQQADTSNELVANQDINLPEQQQAQMLGSQRISGGQSQLVAGQEQQQFFDPGQVSHQTIPQVVNHGFAAQGQFMTRQGSHQLVNHPQQVDQSFAPRGQLMATSPQQLVDPWQQPAVNSRMQGQTSQLQSPSRMLAPTMPVVQQSRQLVDPRMFQQQRAVPQNPMTQAQFQQVSEIPQQSNPLIVRRFRK